MINKTLQKKAKTLVEKSKEKELIKKYKDFLKTDLAKETALNDKEASYYSSENKEESN